MEFLALSRKLLRMTGLSPEVTEDVLRWVAERTFSQAHFDRHSLHAQLRGQRVSVVFPALNEEATVGTLVASVRRELMVECPLVHEVLVIDSGSVDDTAREAIRAGAQVYRQHDLMTHLGDRPGKGEALWKSLSVVSGDIVVFCDADLLEFDPQLIVGLIGPLVTQPNTSFVKACYDRVLNSGTTIHPTGGGRVTELVARPLLNTWFPQLAGFVQPLAGEYAARTEVFRAIPFGEKYSVETLMLVDIERQFGLFSMAQVDCGKRQHRHKTDQELGVMSAQIQQAVLRRALAHHGVVAAESQRYGDVEGVLMQFDRDGENFKPKLRAVTSRERPPLADSMRRSS